MASAPTVVLGYADRTVSQLPAARRTVLYRIALACWLLPLGVGVAIYLASEVVRLNRSSHGGVASTPAMDHLAVAGLLTIAIGTALAGIGAVLLLAFVVTRWFAAVDRWTQTTRPALTLLGLFGVELCRGLCDHTARPSLTKRSHGQ